MKKVLFALVIVCVALVSCDGGMTLKQIANMSPSERSVIQELKITGIKGDGDLDLNETLQGFRSLKKLEISKSFKGNLAGGACHEQVPELETLIAKGATVVGWETFRSCEKLKYVVLPNVVELENHAFQGSRYFRRMNSIEELDFPNLRVIGGYALGGCVHLKVLKLGSNEPIACYLSLFGDFPEVSEQVDLYLGEYEFTHNVKGNQWTVHSRPDGNIVSFDNFSETGELDIQKSGAEGTELGTYTFKNIYPYK